MRLFGKGELIYRLRTRPIQEEKLGIFQEPRNKAITYSYWFIGCLYCRIHLKKLLRSVFFRWIGEKDGIRLPRWLLYD